MFWFRFLLLLLLSAALWLFSWPAVKKETKTSKAMNNWPNTTRKFFSDDPSKCNTGSLPLLRVFFLGLTLYICVRLRMYVGPAIRKNFGQWARRAYWLFTILVMIALTNAALYVFRIYLSSQAVTEETLLLELWFAIMSLAVALGLIFRKISRNSLTTEDPEQKP